MIFQPEDENEVVVLRLASRRKVEVVVSLHIRREN
jgi:hypothetical protein